jgi:hypothetical protein
MIDSASICRLNRTSSVGDSNEGSCDFSLNALLKIKIRQSILASV